MRTLICGSMAYDNIMVFQGHFSDQIMPDQIHILNVSFLVPQLRREFGGCAGNIAHNLKLLGGDPLIMATVGSDAGPYLTRLDNLDDNQITAFHPGAMNFSHLDHVSGWMDVDLAIIAPDGRDGMLLHARELAAQDIPFVFDPGQGLPMFSGEELLNFVKLATYVAVNDYEGKMLEERTGVTLDRIAEGVEALIVTRGAEGSSIFTSGQRIDIPCVKADEILDPTGCGDAYRAGLLYGISSGLDWRKTGQIASVMGSIKIASRGGQNHVPTREEINAKYLQAFGESL